MRTDDEIVARIKERESGDPFGFEIPYLVSRLPFSVARQFLVKDAKESEWKMATRERELLIAEMLDYMPFAWEKANGCRGISASRSLSHYAAWTWLAGDDFGDLQDYEYYGKDKLVDICTRYGWDAARWDNGRRINSEDE